MKMDERIKVELSLLEEIAGELSRLSGRIDRLENELRSVRSEMPSDAQMVVQLEIMKEHARMSEATDRATGLARRIRRAIAIFEQCEMTLLNLAQELESGENREIYVSKRLEK